jgi:hypothetical protein
MIDISGIPFQHLLPTLIANYINVHIEQRFQRRAGVCHPERSQGSCWGYK